MTRLRSEYDADLVADSEPSSFRTETKRFPFPCSICGSTYYFEEAAGQRLRNAIEESGENPFVCSDCEGEYADLAHGTAG